MVQTSSRKVSLQAFLSLPDSDGRYELVDGEIIPKVSPKRFHAGLQKAFIKLMDDWAEDKGHFYPEWAVVLHRNGDDWVPVPDLTYVSFEHLGSDWLEDSPCPVPADLVIEIISPNQTFGEMTTKASDYLYSGILRVWIVDPQAKTITVFTPETVPITHRNTDVLADPLLPGLALVVNEIFERAGLSRSQIYGLLDLKPLFLSRKARKK